MLHSILVQDSNDSFGLRVGKVLRMKDEEEEIESKREEWEGEDASLTAHQRAGTLRDPFLHDARPRGLERIEADSLAAEEVSRVSGGSKGL
jgi:hypothetical protein